MGGTEKPTRIMYEANLSWKIFNEILSSLEAQGLIEEINVTMSRDSSASSKQMLFVTVSR